MNRFINRADDLVTTHEQIRAGFLAIALEKSRAYAPYIAETKAFRTMAASAGNPDEFLNMVDIWPFLLAASGLSEKALKHLNKDDQDAFIRKLIEEFLKPAGEHFIDEAVYRFLLTKGDAVGGKMRNRAGIIGQEKLVRCIISCMRVKGLEYEWLDKEQKKSAWKKQPDDDLEIEKRIKAMFWENSNGSRCLWFNKKIEFINKNVDICLFDTKKEELSSVKNRKRECSEAIMLGELKGGIDPAGADEHWKTGNTALERIRAGYRSINRTILTSFVAAAIEKAMADEIYSQLDEGILSNAANLTNNDQLVDYCNWLIEI